MMVNVVVDNHEIQTSPFKGPFKGKGANRKAVQILKDDLEQILSDMESVVKEYNKTMPRGRARYFRPPHLCVFRPRGIPHLWWREANKSSKYVHLFDSDRGTEILSQYLPSTVEMFQEFDRKRLHYNLKATLVGHAVEHYGKYLDGNQLLDDLDFETFFDAGGISGFKE
jgi:hypothetical protein